MNKLICIHLITVPLSIIILGDVPYPGASYPCSPTPYLSGSAEPPFIAIPIPRSKNSNNDNQENKSDHVSGRYHRQNH